MPDVRHTHPPRLPPATDLTLSNGLRVIAIRRRGVPRFEVRLRSPLVRGSVPDAGRVRLFPETMMSGAGGRSSFDIAQRLEELGADLQTGADVETLYVSGSGLTATVSDFFDLLADVLLEPEFPGDEVAIERERVAHELTINQSQPAAVAAARANGRLYPRHPYGRGLTPPDAVRKIGPAGLKRLHTSLLGAAGASVVIVGDLTPDRAAAEADRTLGRWPAGPPVTGLPDPPTFQPGAIVLVDRPGAVQTNIRMVGPALSRRRPDYAPLSVATTAFGGYFSSRLTTNVRERRGYSYSPVSRIDHWLKASHIQVVVDVATEVTAPALVEISYELARMASAPLDDDELAAAQRYLVGNLAMAVQTQAGLASYVSMLAGHGLDITYLRDQPRAIEAVTVETAHELAQRFLGPPRLATVLVGDASRIGTQVEALGDVAIEALPG